MNQSMSKSTGTYKLKKVIFKVSYKTIQSRSCNSDLGLPGDGAERNIYGSATLIPIVVNIGINLIGI
jgi:hypothetical protein